MMTPADHELSKAVYDLVQFYGNCGSPRGTGTNDDTMAVPIHLMRRLHIARVNAASKTARPITDDDILNGTTDHG